MQPQLQITSRIQILKNNIFKDGKIAFEYSGENTSDFLRAIYKYLEISYPKFYKMDNLSKLGFLASELLLKGKKLAENYLPEEIGICLSNNNSSLDADIKYFQSTQDIASPSLFLYTLPNIVIGEICIRNKIQGENSFFISSDFDPEVLYNYVELLFEEQVLRACICGWVECFESEYSVLLMLVEMDVQNSRMTFTKDNCSQLYNQINGKING